MLTCELILDWFDDYCDGKLEPANRMTFESHLSTCDACKAMVEDLTLMREVMQDMPLVSLPEDFNETLHEKLVVASEEIKQEIKQRNKIKRFPFRMNQAGPLIGLAAATMIIATGTAQLGKMAWWAPHQNEMAYDSVMTDAASAPEASSNQVAPESAPAAKQGVAFGTSGAGDANLVAGTMPEGGSNVNAATDPQLSLGQDRQLVRTGQLSMVVGNLEDFTLKVQTITEASGGYVESSYTGTNEVLEKNQTIGNQLNANFVLRVPADNFSDVLEKIKALGKVETSQQNVMDVTAVVVDLQATLDNLKSRESTLKSLMATAKTVEDVMRVEKELSATRMQIDQLSAQLKAQTAQVSYSSLYLNVTQSLDVDNKLSGVDANVLDLALQGLIKNVNLVTAWIQIAFIWLVSWSWAIIIVLAFGLGLTKTKTYRNWRKK